jgi:serine protease Do
MPEQEQQASVGGNPLGGELGLAVQELTPDIADSLGAPDAQGVVVSEVEEGSLADEVGMRRGDLILEVNQQKITTVQEYRTALGHAAVTNSTLFLIRRGANTVYLALRPQE